MGEKNEPKNEFLDSNIVIIISLISVIMCCFGLFIISRLIFLYLMSTTNCKEKIIIFIVSKYENDIIYYYKPKCPSV